MARVKVSYCSWASSNNANLLSRGNVLSTLISMKQIQCVIPGLVQKLRSFLFSAKLVSISKFSWASEINQNTEFHSFTDTCYKQRDHQIKIHTIVMLREDSFLFPFFQMDTEKRRGKEESVLTCRFTTDTAILVGEVLQAMRLVKIYKESISTYAK